jgi:hypothetical protein
MVLYLTIVLISMKPKQVVVQELIAISLDAIWVLQVNTANSDVRQSDLPSVLEHAVTDQEQMINFLAKFF